MGKVDGGNAGDFAFRADLPAYLAGDGNGRGGGRRRGVSRRQRVIPSAKGYGDARACLGVDAAHLIQGMRPAVAAPQDVRGEFIGKPECFQIFQKVPESPALVLRQVFHRLRRARHRRMSAFYQLHERPQGIECGARAERGRNGFNVFAQIRTDVAHETIGGFGGTDIVDRKYPLAQSAFLCDGVPDHNEERFGDGGAVADDVEFEGHRGRPAALLAAVARLPQEERLAPATSARSSRRAKEISVSFFAARSRICRASL